MVRQFKHIIVFQFFTLLLVACTATNQDGREILKIMKSREIKKVSEADILNKAMEIGNMITDSSQMKLSRNLIQSMKSEGVVGSVKFCNTNAIQITDSLSKKYGAVIKRTSLKTRNKNNNPNKLEMDILRAYENATTNKIQISPSVQIIENTTQILFTKPILIKNPVCLNCHGNVGTTLSEENGQLIKSLYPNDKATGYQINDFRGMWSIILDKKTIVNAL
ncbi:MAG: hypothetical protein ACJA2S_001379 [Cyclobacteriaceae bacterium]|jgi:hypothetical protein